MKLSKYLRDSLPQSQHQIDLLAPTMDTYHTLKAHTSSRIFPNSAAFTTQSFLTCCGNRLSSRRAGAGPIPVTYEGVGSKSSRRDAFATVACLRSNPRRCGLGFTCRNSHFHLAAITRCSRPRSLRETSWDIPQKIRVVTGLGFCVTSV